MMSVIASNLTVLRDRMAAAALRSGRAPENIRLIAVSKRQPAALMLEAVRHGQTVFGENFLQEAREKKDILKDSVTIHFIGHLQTNKARMAADTCSMVETVDRLKLALTMDGHLARQQRHLDILVQVNVGGEDQKSGVRPENAAELLRRIRQECPQLRVKGLMTMPPYCPDPEDVRPYFQRLRQLAEDFTANNLLGEYGPVQLSMGMSHDFEVAIEEGATMVRIGSALFGPRLAIQTGA